MNRWRKSRVGDEIALAYGKSLPARARHAGAIKVYGSNGCVGSHSSPLVLGPGIVVGRKGSVGKVVYSDQDFWPIDTTYYVVNKKGHNWRFLYYLLSFLGLDELNTHSAVPGLNREIAHSMPVSIPEKPEQEVVARVLDRLERAVCQEELAIERSQELKHAAMQTLFMRGLQGETQKQTDIGPMPVSWNVTAIDDVAISTQYGLSVRGRTSGAYPILRMNCQEDGKVHYRNLQFVDLDAERFETHRVKPGDLLFNRTNSINLVGRMAIIKDDRPAVFASYLVRLMVDADRCIPEFLNYFMNCLRTQEEIKKLASRAVGQANINATKLRTVLFPLPAIDEQRSIVDILSAVDRKIDLHRRKWMVLEELFKALLHKTMTGEIRIGDLDLLAFDRVANTTDGG